jgi:large subunit ribosomal protein L6
MSRIGKRAIPVPAKTEVSVAGSTLTVKGPKATLVKEVHPHISIVVEGSEVTVSPKNDTRLAKALWGTYASHLKNMMKGASEPYVKKLILEGIGYRMAVAGTELTLSVGFSHQVKMQLPEGVSAVVEKNELTLTGSDKEVLGQFAANVRAVKKPEPYKGKGFRYSDEVILRKQGKKAS